MTIKTMARVTVALAAIAGGVAIGAGGAGWWSGGTALAASNCANYQLTMKSISSQGATGHVFEMFRIHDLLPGSCTLYGYPGTELLDKSFQSLPSHVTRSSFPQGGPGPSTVTLTRGNDAYFVLSWVHLPTPGQACPIAKYLMIWAPNDRLPVVTSAGNGDVSGGGIMACGGNLTVSPVSAKKFWTP